MSNSTLQGSSTPRALRIAFALLGIVTASFAEPTAEHPVRAATVEVVMRKPVKDMTVYNRPLPLELIPFSERNDAFWPLGTAFAIGPQTFVSAGHVMLSGVGSQFGAPLIRDRQGRIHEIDRVLKFSAAEDFMVFSVKTAAPVVLQTRSEQARVDEPVLAAGNALGEGIVIRQGVLTSMTDEEQDGRWKWLRFSAAASPGNSGGPLTDTQHRVIGVVIGRSPNENLNYALPVARVLTAPQQARFDQRESFRLPIMDASITGVLREHFSLPLPYTEFSEKYVEVGLRYYRAHRDRLLSENADRLFPRGGSRQLLVSRQWTDHPSLLRPDDDGKWRLQEGTYDAERTLNDGSRVQVGHVAGSMLFSLRRPPGTFGVDYYTDSEGAMRTLLKGMMFPRTVGSEVVYVESLGRARSERTLRDTYDRKWQLRTWALGYADVYFLALLLPTPDGYAGIFRVASADTQHLVAEQLILEADYFHTRYNGTLAQWRAFLQNEALRPSALDDVSLSHDASGLRYHSRRAEAFVSPDVLRINDESMLMMSMAYMRDDEHVSWDTAGFQLSEAANGGKYVKLERQPRPGPEADEQLKKVWAEMLGRVGSYGGQRGHDDEWKKFWVTYSLGTSGEPGSSDPNVTVLYAVSCGGEGFAYPRQVNEMIDRLLPAVRIKER